MASPPPPEVETWAERHGWRYAWDGRFLLPFLADRLGTRLGAQASAVVRGTRAGTEFTVFEHGFYSPCEHGIHSPGEHRFLSPACHPIKKTTLTVAVVPLRGAAPALQLLPRRKATIREIDGVEVLTGHKIFDQRYRLRAADGDVAVRVRGSGLIDHLADDAAVPFLVSGDRVIAWAAGRMTVRNAEHLVAAAIRLAGMLTKAWKPSSKIVVLPRQPSGSRRPSGDGQVARQAYLTVRQPPGRAGPSGPVSGRRRAPGGPGRRAGTPGTRSGAPARPRS